MIAIGGTIGTGLFIGGGATIALAGPGGALWFLSLLSKSFTFSAFAFVSVMVFFIVTSLGEMAAYWPVSGSFNTYADRFVDPALGTFTTFLFITLFLSLLMIPCYSLS